MKIFKNFAYYNFTFCHIMIFNKCVMIFMLKGICFIEIYKSRVDFLNYVQNCKEIKF